MWLDISILRPTSLFIIISQSHLSWTLCFKNPRKNVNQFNPCTAQQLKVKMGTCRCIPQIDLNQIISTLVSWLAPASGHSRRRTNKKSSQNALQGSISPYSNGPSERPPCRHSLVAWMVWLVTVCVCKCVYSQDYLQWTVNGYSEKPSSDFRSVWPPRSAPHSVYPLPKLTPLSPHFMCHHTQCVVYSTDNNYCWPDQKHAV